MSFRCGWFCVAFIKRMNEGIPFKLATGYKQTKTENEDEMKEME